MSSLTARFSARILKRATSAEGETTPDSEASSIKCPQQSGSDEKAHKDQVVMLWTLRNEPLMPCWHWMVLPRTLPRRLVHCYRMGLQSEDLPKLIKM